MGDTSTVSELWEAVSSLRSKRQNASPLPFDWFILSLSLLYAIGAIDTRGDLLIKSSSR
nr:ABC-three component system middle component 6 [Lichenihabitans psoromatis]